MPGSRLSTTASSVRLRPLGALAMLSGLLLLAGCGSDDGASASGSSTRSVIDADRCAANHKAGRITYLTNYGAQGSGSLDQIAAEELGFFDDVCLDVQIRPGNGDPVAATQLTSAGTVTMTTLGSVADAITAASNDIDTEVVAAYGNTLAIALMTMPEVTDLTQIEGGALGYKGAMPPQITAMLDNAGVDLDEVKQVGVSYDPTILPRGQVDALTAYKSNEPLQLAASGDDVTVWDPESFGIKGTFGAVVANHHFAAEHPTAVSVFLRASFHALAYCSEHEAECGAFGKDIHGPGYDEKQNGARLAADAELGAGALSDGATIGMLDDSAVAGDLKTLIDFDIIDSEPDLDALIQPQYMDEIAGSDGAVQW